MWTRRLRLAILLLCALLLSACGGGGLLDGGEVTVAGPGHWGGPFGQTGTVMEVTNTTRQPVQIVDVTIQPSNLGQDAFEVIEFGQAVDAGAVRVLPPGQIAPPPITVAAGATVDVFVTVQLHSCDAIGDWEIDPDTQKVDFLMTVLGSFDLHLADGETLVTNVFPSMDMLQPLEPAVCGA